MKEIENASIVKQEKIPEKIPTKPTLIPEQKNKNTLSINFLSGFLAGALTTAILNPYDQALYLALTKNRPFFSRENFKKPYQGFCQSILQRVISSGSYYILQSELKSRLYPYLHDTKQWSSSFSDLCIGLMAGSVSGILCNGITAIKCYTWENNDAPRSLYSSAKMLWQQGGVKAFTKGTQVTLLRNMTFGGIYEACRHSLANQLSSSSREEKEKTYQAFADLLAAAVGTFFTVPINYARNIQFSTPPELKAPKMREIFKNLREEAKKEQANNFSALKRYGWFLKRMQTLPVLGRVPIDLTIGQQIFEYSKRCLAQEESLVSEKSSSNAM